MADELTDRAALATLMLEASIAIDDIAGRVMNVRIGRSELSAELRQWVERLANGSEVAMDRMLT